MSSTNHTKHYGLSQWEPEDAFLREDFNEDHRKIDEALAELGQRPKIIFGSYFGTSERLQYIPLEFQPKLIMIFSVLQNRVGFDSSYNALLLSGGNHYSGDNNWVRFAEDGGLEAIGAFNTDGREYRYIAFV